jgi:hypothetical protein
MGEMLSSTLFDVSRLGAVPEVEEKRDVPFQKSKWVVPGKLLAGNFPGNRDSRVARRKLTAMLNVGIRAIVNLMQEWEINRLGVPFVPYAELWHVLSVRRKLRTKAIRIPVWDLSAPMPARMAHILDTIDELIAKGMPVYIHCRGGVGRTGTVIACWKIRHGLADRDELVQEILAAPDHSLLVPETGCQISAVRRWQAGR